MMRGSFLLFSVPATDRSLPPALTLIVIRLVYSVVSVDLGHLDLDAAVLGDERRVHVVHVLLEDRREQALERRQRDRLLLEVRHLAAVLHRHLRKAALAELRLEQAHALREVDVGAESVGSWSAGTDGTFTAFRTVPAMR